MVIRRVLAVTLYAEAAAVVFTSWNQLGVAGTTVAVVGRKNSNRMRASYVRPRNETRLSPLARMARCFFDFRSSGSSSIDEEAQNLPDMEAETMEEKAAQDDCDGS
jgi:hypothetical protein